MNDIRFKLFFLLSLLFSNAHSQEMRIWTHGTLRTIDTGWYKLPQIPTNPNTRYVDFSDFVVEVSDVEVIKSVADSVCFKVSEDPWGCTKLPTKIAMIKVDKIYYRFYLETAPTSVEPIEWAFFPDSSIMSIRYILMPEGLDIPKTPCLMWVDVEYENCFVFREIVTEDIVFVNAVSDYAGSLRRKDSVKKYNPPIIIE